MTLAAGTKFGPYQILAPIGAGGMGEVYRATDTRLDRLVAIKVLPQHLSQNPSLRERFEREARAISAISHPHICTLFDIGRENGTDYMVMELLEGQTLADHLARGPLTIDQTLRFATEIADALDKAHRQGVIHRDLKPGNIMITRSGAKLLDFGLARFADPSGERRAMSGETDGPTVQKPLTQEGTILGTFQYMAPEQLEGTEADARTDIFALGAVVYEMVTGRRAFEGKNKTSLIAAIVSGEPPAISSLQPLTPTGLERVVKTCLAKDPEDRWQTAHDVTLELKWITQEHSQPSARAERSTRRRLQRRLPWIVAALAAAVAIALGIQSLRQLDTPPRQVRFQFGFLPGANVVHSVVAPDGERIASFVRQAGGESVIAIRSLAGLDVREIPGFLAPRTDLFWSPDGRVLGFTVNRKLMKMDLSGGPPQEICPSDYGVGAAWTEGNIIVFARRFGEGLFRVSADGGTPELLTRLDLKARESLHGWPKAVPGSDLVLFLRRTVASERNQIHAIPTGGGTATKVIDADALIGATRRHLFYIRDGTLFRQRFDLRDRKVHGKPERIVDQVYYSEIWAAGKASVDATGSVVTYERHVPRRIALRWFDRTGKPAGDLSIQEDVDTARLSPDGRLLVTDRFDPRHGANDVWVYDLARQIESRLTNSPAGDENPRWSPDGRSIVFESDLNGLYEPHIVPANGSAEPRLLLHHLGGDTYIHDWSRDGTTFLLEVSDPKTSNDLWTAPAAEPSRATRFLATAAREESPKFSPDGKSIAYVSNASGRNEVYLQSFPRSDARQQISTSGGELPEWSPNGTAVFYVAQDKLMIVDMARRGREIDPGIPRLLFQLPENRRSNFFTPGSDGQRFLVPVYADGQPATEIQVIFTWPPPDPE